MISYPYIIIVLIIAICTFQYWKTRNQYYFYISSIIVFCFIAFRAPVIGADTYDYVKYFIGKQTYYSSDDDRPLELLFLLYNWMLHLFTHNGVIYLMINTLLTFAPIYYLIKKYSLNKPMSILLFFLLGYHVIYFVALRQIIAISFNLLSIIFVLEKRKHYWWWFGFFSIISYLFHTSSVIVILIYLLTYIIAIKKRYYFFIAIIFSVITGFFLERYSYLNIFSLLLTPNISAFDRISFYLGNDYYSLANSPLNIALRTSLIGLFVFSALNKHVLNNWLSKIYLSSLIFYNLFHSFPLISRFNIAFSIMSIIVFTWVFGMEYKKNKKAQHLINVMVIVIILYMTRSFIIDCINPDLKNSTRMHPYYWFFEDYSKHPSIRRF